MTGRPNGRGSEQVTFNGIETQGKLWGLPYDWRRPTAARVRERYWNPGGPLLTPKVFGWGLTINLAHPGGAALAAGVVATVVAVALGLGG